MKKNLIALVVAATAFTSAPMWAATLNLTNNLQLWFRADAGVTTNGSGNVSVWADQSGNANNATNTTAANQPVWVDGALNGLPVLRFDGVNDVLSTLGSVNVTNGLSIFIVAKNDVRKNYNGIFRIHTSPFSGSAYLEEYWQAGNTDAGSGNPVHAVNRVVPGGTFGAILTSDAKPAVNNYYIYDVLASGNAATQRVQGVQTASGSGISVLPYDQAQAHLGIGFGGVTTSGLLDGDMAEILVYNVSLSLSDRNAVEGYLADKYLLTIPEPTTLCLFALGLLIVRRLSGRRI